MFYYYATFEMKRMDAIYCVTTITGVTQTKLTNLITGHEQWIPTKVVWTNLEWMENWLVETTLFGIWNSLAKKNLLKHNKKQEQFITFGRGTVVPIFAWNECVT